MKCQMGMTRGDNITNSGDSQAMTSVHDNEGARGRSEVWENKQCTLLPCLLFRLAADQDIPENLRTQTQAGWRLSAHQVETLRTS
jgi:hypothetical protein